MKTGTLIGVAAAIAATTSYLTSSAMAQPIFGHRSIVGLASWYGPTHQGRLTASGERFNKGALTAAHRTLPFGTLLIVTSSKTGRSAIVRVNDRGPFEGRRAIDLSEAAARAIGLKGVGAVRLARL